MNNGTDDRSRPVTGATRQASAADRMGARWMWPGAIWLAVTLTTLAARPPMVAIDLPSHAAAWWAWLDRHDVAYLPDGGTDWPPLLFWVIHLGWHLAGVSEMWPRLATALIGLAGLVLIAQLARRLWPDDLDAPRFAALVLAGSGGFVIYLTTTSLAWPLMLTVMLGLFGLAKAWRQGGISGWVTYGAAIALGELSAGAMALWHILPLALAAPAAIAELRGEQLRRWYAAAAAATVAGFLVALGAGAADGMAAGGVSGLIGMMILRPPFLASTDQPSLWYVLILPLILFPWLWWTSLWWAAGRARRQFATSELRLCLLAAATALFVALAAGRQTIDMLPILPPLALAVARIWSGHAQKAKDFHAALPGLMALFVCLFFFMLNIIPVAHLDAVWQRLFDRDLPIWLGGISLPSGLTLLAGSYLLTLLTPRASMSRLVQLALLPVLLALTVNLEFDVALRPFFDLRPMAQRIGELEAEHRPIAVFTRYQGELDLAGRLSTPPVVLGDLPEALAWSNAHPDGVILSFFRGGVLHLPAQPLFLGSAEDYRAALWTSSTVTETDGAVLQPRL